MFLSTFIPVHIAVPVKNVHNVHVDFRPVICTIYVHVPTDPMIQMTRSMMSKVTTSTLMSFSSLLRLTFGPLLFSRAFVWWPVVHVDHMAGDSTKH